MKVKYYDLIGVYVAFLCLIHCLLTPIFLLLPLGLSHNPVIDLCFLSLGIFPVYKVTVSNVSLKIKALLVFSWLLIGVSVALESLFHQENPLTYLGASGLTFGHLLNYKNHKH